MGNIVLIAFAITLWLVLLAVAFGVIYLILLPKKRTQKQQHLEVDLSLPIDIEIGGSKNSDSPLQPTVFIATIAGLNYLGDKDQDVRIFADIVKDLGYDYSFLGDLDSSSINVQELEAKAKQGMAILAVVVTDATIPLTYLVCLTARLGSCPKIPTIIVLNYNTPLAFSRLEFLSFVFMADKWQIKNSLETHSRELHRIYSSFLINNYR